MDKEIQDRIAKDFEVVEQDAVAKALLSIKPRHVMAASDFNLNNTRMAILHLAKGNLQEVLTLTEHAKIDFRDVILWATKKK